MVYLELLSKYNSLNGSENLTGWIPNSRLYTAVEKFIWICIMSICFVSFTLLFSSFTLSSIWKLLSVPCLVGELPTHVCRVETKLVPHGTWSPPPKKKLYRVMDRNNNCTFCYLLLYFLTCRHVALNLTQQIHTKSYYCSGNQPEINV
jgi:hypothetical protein